MSNKFSTVKERILYLLEVKGITKEKFFMEIGMTYGNFTGKAKKTPLNSDAIGNIFSKIPDVNLEWLIAGKGEMFVKSELANPKIEDGNEIILKLIEKNEKLNQEVGELRNENKNLRQGLNDYSKKTIDMDVDNSRYVNEK